jgi:uncharacterized protein (TIGR02598 family)
MRKVFTSGFRRQRSIRRLQTDVAFTLVEVVLALGIASFAILTMIALLPVAISSTNDSLDESVALNVMSGIIADRKSSPFAAPSQTYAISALTTGMSAITNTFGITDSGTSTNTLTQARFRVDCAITPPPSGTTAPYLSLIRISWPAAAAKPTAFVETVATFPQP